MSGVTIKILGGVDGQPTPYDDTWVAGDYTPEPEAFGSIVIADNAAEALVFPSIIEAREFWAQEHPQGMGGQNISGPNRPLTYFNIQIDAAPDAP